MSINSCNHILIGFINNVESLPNNFDEFNSKIKLRQLFLALINPFIKEHCTFTIYERKHLSKYSLEIIFKEKIKSLLPISYVKTSKRIKSFRLDRESTIIINNYLNKEEKNIAFFYKNLNSLAKVISLCFINNKIQVQFDINLLFHQFVFNKIKNLHKHKEVIDSGDSICILSQDNTPIKIYTSWKNIDAKQMNIKHELNHAIESIKQSEFKQVYLVYPKALNFKRHLPIEVDELKKESYYIKVIPYSLRSTLRNLK